jgi:hypothetical protein
MTQSQITRPKVRGTNIPIQNTTSKLTQAYLLLHQIILPSVRRLLMEINIVMLVITSPKLRLMDGISIMLVLVIRWRTWDLLIGLLGGLFKREAGLLFLKGNDEITRPVMRRILKERGPQWSQFRHCSCRTTKLAFV